MTSLKLTVSPLALSLLIGLTMPAYAQDTAEAVEAIPEAETEAVAADAVEGVDEAAEADSDDAVSAMEAMADGDENLEMRDGEDGEPDAMVMLSDVLFGFGDATLQASAIETLASIAPGLAQIGPFTLAGHTDSIGDEAFNIALGERRAAAVRDWLVNEGGVDAGTITVVGIGEADPLVPNRAEDGSDLPENRAQNRRVEFVVSDEG